jgi:hypothetical protein
MVGTSITLRPVCRNALVTSDTAAGELYVLSRPAVNAGAFGDRAITG